MSAVSDNHIAFIGEAENENDAGDGDGECPDAENGEKRLPFAPFSTSKGTRDMKETIDGENCQVPDRCRTEENIEENVEITE